MTAIEFDNISKQYRLGLVSTWTLSHDLNRFWQTKVLRREDIYMSSTILSMSQAEIIHKFDEIANFSGNEHNQSTTFSQKKLKKDMSEAFSTFAQIYPTPLNSFEIKDSTKSSEFKSDDFRLYSLTLINKFPNYENIKSLYIFINNQYSQFDTNIKAISKSNSNTSYPPQLQTFMS